MPRPLEFIWAGAFAMLVATTHIAWPIVFAVSSIATVIVALIQVRRPSYHGIGWQKLNPRLPEWWRSTAAIKG